MNRRDELLAIPRRLSTATRSIGDRTQVKRVEVPEEPFGPGYRNKELFEWWHRNEVASRTRYLREEGSRGHWWRLLSGQEASAHVFVTIENDFSDGNKADRRLALWTDMACFELEQLAPEWADMHLLSDVRTALREEWLQPPFRPYWHHRYTRLAYDTVDPYIRVQSVGALIQVTATFLLTNLAVAQVIHIKPVESSRSGRK